GPRRRAQLVLVVAQIAVSFLPLVAAGLFVRTLNKLHSVQLGYARENILLFSLNARQAGHRDPEMATFYANLRKRFESIPGVISERLARTYFGNENPLGRRVTFVDEKRDLEIVGVSANVRYGGLKEGSPMTVFTAASQFPPDRVTYALRVAGDPLTYVRSVHEVVREADSRIPVTNVFTQAAEIDRTISREITFSKLCTGFAVLALLIACVGLYGTVSYSVARQVGEIGIRMALGAQRGAVVWMVLRRVILL